MCVYILYIIIIYLNYLSKRYIEKRIGPRNIRLCIRIDKYQIFIDFTWFEIYYEKSVELVCTRL